MPEQPPLDAAALPQPYVERDSPWLPSLVWLIPLLAALIGLGLAAKSVFDQGPTITLSFHSGEGLEPGKTKVKYKDVEIGQVRSIKLGRDLSKVLVTIDIRKDAQRFAVKDTRFWVVRPRIGASGVTGLNTLLSGAYIGVDAGKSEESSSDFVGLDSAPPLVGDQPGRLFRLHGESLGSIDVSSPVFYRRVPVGQVVAYALNKAGSGIDLTVFVAAPYDQLVGQDARWWHASGIDVRLDSTGFKLNTESLAALVVGGLAFESQDGQKPAVPAAAGSTFALADNQVQAMREPDGAPVPTVFYFDQSLRGLAPGATVDFRGIVLGEVRSVTVEYDAARRSFRMPVTVDLYPGRLGKKFQRSLATAGNDVLERMVQRGLRAQLRTGNLLTSQLYIALDFFPQAPPATLDMTQNPVQVPTVPNSLDELQVQLASIVKKLDQVPFAAISTNLNNTLASAAALLRQLDTQVLPEMKDTLSAAHQTFDSARQVLQQGSPLQADVQQALQQLTQTLQSLRGLTDYLERHPEALLRGKPGDKK